MLTTKLVTHIGICLKYSVRDTAYFTLLGGFAFSLYVADQGGALAHQLFQSGSPNSGVNLFAVYGWVASILAVNTVMVLVMDFTLRLLLRPTRWLAVSGWTLLQKRTAKASAVEVPHVG